MMQENVCTGKQLREMFRTGTRVLDKHAASVNALNVFPVPDGDTGTNMLLTMQAAITEANTCPDNDASAVAKAMAQGALIGARGNGGVILSQMLRGLAQALEGKDSFAVSDLVNAFTHASLSAYKALSHPEEGTILTVMREASEAAKSLLSNDGTCDLLSLMEAVVKEAKGSVSRTPDLLPVLWESGVVDAGGQGLCFILEGILLYLRGDELGDHEFTAEIQPVSMDDQSLSGEAEYGYCTNFMVYGYGLDVNEIRQRLSEMGESVVVVGDEKTVRVHVHTFDPGAILSYGTSLGTLRQIKIDNMEDQHRDFVAAHGGRSSSADLGNVSTVVVASGEGFLDVFDSIGATQVVSGGETMNPSVQDLLHAVESMPTDQVIILPNNPDILPAALQVNDLTKKSVAVVSSRTMPQGVTALLTFNYEADLETNVQAMTSSLSSVRTGKIATAVRSMRYKSLGVRKGQVVGFVNEELVVAAYTMEEAFKELLNKMNARDGEIMTVYYGSNVDQADVERLLDPVRDQYPNLEIEVVFGGQPHYDYLISVE
ncbi:MAG: DAK2 domain-containing protein [Chloroflexota bacterium]